MRIWVVSRLRTLLAGGLLAGLYLVGALVVTFDLAILGLPVAGYLVLRDLLPAGPVSGLVVAVASYLVLGTVLWLTLAAIVTGQRAVNRMGEPWRSIGLPETGTEPLRALVAEVCAAAGTAVPRHLCVTAASNAAAAQLIGWPRRNRGGRALYLGLPLLAAMSVDELRAVLSHEMGHYAGGHARASALAQRGAVALDAIRDAFQMLLVTPPKGKSLRFKPLMTLSWWLLLLYALVGYWAFTAYATLYWRLSFALRRSQEYDADQIAESIVGAAELGAALRRAQAVSAAWRDFQARYIVPMRRAGCVPDAAFDVFGAMVADGAYRDVMLACERESGRQATAPTDTHPCLADRLARLDEGAGGGGARGGAAAGTGGADGRLSGLTLVPVLADWEWRAAAVTQTMESPGQQALRSWEECLRSIGQPRGDRPPSATLVIQPQEDDPYGEGPWPAIADAWLAVGDTARILMFAACAVLGLVLGVADHQYQASQHTTAYDPSAPSCPPQASADVVFCTQVTVQSGDTLQSLACRYSDTVAELQTLNGLGNSTKVSVGEMLYTETSVTNAAEFSSACPPLQAIPTSLLPPKKVLNKLLQSPRIWRTLLPLLPKDIPLPLPTSAVGQGKK